MKKPAKLALAALGSRSGRWIFVIGGIAIVSVAFWVVRRIERTHLEYRLLATLPDAVIHHPDLVHFASAQAEPLYEDHCAACHGDDMKGNAAIGAPNLTDSIWLYGDGSVFDIERTILFGVRSGMPRTRDITEMPAFGERGILTPGQINDMVQYVLKLSHRPYDRSAAQQGPAIFYSGQASCFDCHASDAKGSADYGAPDLTANVFNWGGTPHDIYDSIYFGHHGIMPGWYGKLSLEQIRALAVYVYARSHPPHNREKTARADTASVRGG